MFCSVCGYEMKETDKVCLACGQPNENYVEPEGAEEAAAEVAAEEATVAVAVEEAVEVVETVEAVEEAPKAEKKSLVKPIVALALSAYAFLSFASGLIPLIMAIVARVLAKPYKKVTDKPISIFYKITNILSIVTIILSAIAMVVGLLSMVFSFLGTLMSGAAVVGGVGLGLGGMYFGDMFDLDFLDILMEIFEFLFEIIEEILEAIGLL